MVKGWVPVGNPCGKPRGQRCYPSIRFSIRVVHGLSVARIIGTAAAARDISDGSILLLPQIPCFALMTNRKNQDSVLIFLQAIKGHVTGTSARYDQLTQSVLHRPADKGMPD